MQLMRHAGAGNGRVRFVFDDAVVSLGLAATVTLEDIACALETLARRRHGALVAVDVILAAAPGPPHLPREP